MKNNSTCPICIQGYRMGYTGTIDGCDKCLGNVRDDDGYFYGPDENEITLADVQTGAIEVRQRPKVNGE